MKVIYFRKVNNFFCKFHFSFSFFLKLYMCSPSWTLLPPPSPYHPSGSSQCTSPKHPALCIEPGLASHFIHDISHVCIDMLHFSGNLNWIQGYDSPSTFLDLVFRKPLYGPLLTMLESAEWGVLEPRGPIHLEHKPSSYNNQDTAIIYKHGWKSTFKAAWVSSSHPPSL